MSELTRTTHSDKPQRKARKPKLPRTAMPCQPAKQRATNFEEVTSGYDDQMAAIEASRCLQCKKPSAWMVAPSASTSPPSSG
jgi:hypothetical protein